MGWINLLTGVALALLIMKGDTQCTGTQPTTVYQVTVRDFLPVWCMTPAQAAGIDMFDSGDRLTRADSNDRRMLNNSVSYQGQSGSSDETDCPFQADFIAGKIQGHPDFNRNHYAGWDMNFLFDHEDQYITSSPTGNIDNTYLSGTCSRGDLNGQVRPPNNPSNTPTNCQSRLEVYTERFKRNEMDLHSSGLLKPKYCTDDPNGRCGFIDFNGPIYQTSTKFFQDLWWQDDEKFNKRVGTTLVLTDKTCNGEFTFDSGSDAENPQSNPGKYTPHEAFDFIEGNPGCEDVFECPVWPRGPTKKGAGQEKFLHTTEIHAFFKYDGTEVFTFDGDDDVWVYINGNTVIELGGLHSEAEMTIDLSSPFAQADYNLVIGEIYTFDLFHAERQPSGSNFAVTTTLVDGCNVLDSGSTFFPDVDGNTITLSRGVDFPFTQGSVYGGEPIGLLPDGSTQLASYIFVNERINVVTGFVIDFDFDASGSPEGFALVFHSRDEGLTNIPLSTGANLGFKGFKNSFAIGFDMCEDRGVDPLCRVQNVSVFYPNDRTQENKPSDTRARVYDRIWRSLRFSDTHSVKIAYYADPPALEVIIDNSLYLREQPFDPFSALGSDAAFVGFTGTTSDTPGGITISNWRMESVDVVSGSSVPVDFVDGVVPTVTKEMTGDGIQAEGYTIQTKDGCGLDIEFGNRKQNAKGFFVEEAVNGSFADGRLGPLVVEIEPDDNGDGTYSYNLQVFASGLFNLALVYGQRGEACPLTVDIVPNVSATVNFGTSSENCFYAEIPSAVRVFPLTDAPTAAPTTLAEVPTISDDTAVFVAGIGGGVVGFLGVVAAFFVVAYRRRWQQEKEFIEEGAAYRLDANTNFNNNDKASVAGQKLLNSRAAILRARAQRDNITRNKELGKLETEQEDLIEQIRLAKAQVAKQSTVQARPQKVQAPRPANVKLEF